MCIESFEREIVCHCAPTLTGLKPANLFTYHGCACKGDDVPACPNQFTLQDAIQLCASKLEQNGIHITSMGSTANGGMRIFVYRPQLLDPILKDERVIEFLDEAAYDLESIDSALDSLRQRLICADAHTFPHEIGFFLGYPYEDVIRFIVDGICAASCTGCWCSYTNTPEARLCFCRYNMCTKICTRMFDDGVSISQMPVMGHECVPVFRYLEQAA